MKHSKSPCEVSQMPSMFLHLPESCEPCQCICHHCTVWISGYLDILGRRRHYFCALQYCWKCVIGGAWEKDNWKKYIKLHGRMRVCKTHTFHIVYQTPSWNWNWELALVLLKKIWKLFGNKRDEIHLKTHTHSWICHTSVLFVYYS